jgi:two-component system, OmpR family, phosphate regulon sensor histidine kinase PhoR
MGTTSAQGSQVLARDGTVLAPGDDTHVTVVDAVPIRRAPTDLRALLTASLSAMMAQAKAADVTLTVSVDERVPSLVRIDADKIAWVVASLVGNALRYVRRGSPTMPGGSIAVRASYQAIRPSVVIDVQDDGPGIPAEKLPMLFETAPNQPRAALGLLIVHDFVTAHAGHLDVRSGDAEEPGTTIRITLPI